MNRTRWIVALAAGLTLVAAVLTYGRETASQQGPAKTPTPPTSKPPVAKQDKASKLIHLQTALSGDKLLVGGDGRVFVDVTLKADEPPGRTRPRVSTALVIDRSGSMSGEKLERAKQASQRFVDQLRDGDRVAVISFGSDVATVAEMTTLNADTRATLRQKISDIQDNGGTNISGGLLAGEQEVRRMLDGEGVSRIILMSDGQANEGITSTEDLQQLARDSANGGIPISTIGLGLDFNEDLMRNLAEFGTGQYHFVRDAEGLASIFESEMKTLSATVAKHAQVRLKFADGVEVERIYGYPYQTEGNVAIIPMADLFGGQQRKLIAKLKVPAGQEGTRPVVSVSFQYDDAIGSQTGLSLETKLEVAMTSDPAAVDAAKNKIVLAKVDAVETAETMDKAMVAYQNGDTTTAKLMLEQRIQVSSTANVDLRSADVDANIERARRVMGAVQAAPSAASAGGSGAAKAAKEDAFNMVR